MTDANRPVPESVPPGTPPDAKFAFGRLMVNVAITSVAWMATAMFLIVVSAIVSTVAWLGGGGPSVVVATLVASLVACVCHKRLPLWTSGWWVVVPMAAIPTGALTILWLASVVHLEIGSTVTDCDWPGLETEDCYGRDWGFMQARHMFLRRRGSVDPVRCRRFQESVPQRSVSPLSEDGWIRCDPERPELWSERPCDKLGMNDGIRCYACGGVSHTSDAYLFVQAFNASCDELTVFEGTNVDPMDMEECLRARTRDECPTNIDAVHRLGITRHHFRSSRSDAP